MMWVSAAADADADAFAFAGPVLRRTPLVRCSG